MESSPSLWFFLLYFFHVKILCLLHFSFYYLPDSDHRTGVIWFLVLQLPSMILCHLLWFHENSKLLPSLISSHCCDCKRTSTKPYLTTPHVLLLNAELSEHVTRQISHLNFCEIWWWHSTWLTKMVLFVVSHIIYWAEATSSLHQSLLQPAKDTINMHASASLWNN